MNVRATDLAEVMILTPITHRDSRGEFRECFRQSEFEAHCGQYQFVQDNLSRSLRGSLRGLHYQRTRPQGKLIQVLNGRIFDVAVDIRPHSPTYGQWIGYILSGDLGELMWIPPGFAHGFYVLSDNTDVHYKCTDYYSPLDEMVIRWNSPRLNIKWPILPDVTTVMSDKDALSPCF